MTTPAPSPKQPFLYLASFKITPSTTVPVYAIHILCRIRPEISIAAAPHVSIRQKYSVLVSASYNPRSKLKEFL
jgi:hypothetical protein